MAGCKSAAPADDAALNTQVQAKLFADQNLSGQPIQASVSKGVVTLNGSVSTDSARSLASGDAAQAPGIKTVINNLVVQPASAAASPAPVPDSMSAPMPAPANKPGKPSAAVHQPAFQPAPIVRNSPPQLLPQQNQPQQNQPEQNQPPQQAQLPPPPPAPPTPVVQNIYAACRHHNPLPHYADPG